MSNHRKRRLRRQAKAALRKRSAAPTHKNPRGRTGSAFKHRLKGGKGNVRRGGSRLNAPNGGGQ